MRQQAMKVPDPVADSRSLHQIRLDILGEFGPRKHEALIQILGCSKGHFSEVLAGKKHWPDDWTDYIAEHFDFRGDIARYYARKRGLEVRPPRSRPPTEELRRLKYALADLGEVGEAVAKKAANLPDDIFAEEEP